MKSLNKILFVLVSAFLMLSCVKKADTDSDLAKMVGKTIVFPKHLTERLSGDSIGNFISSADFIIVSYTDSTGCSGCKMKLGKWIQLMNDYNRDADTDVRLISIVNPNDSAKLNYDLWQCDFRHPVFLDTTENFKIDNELPDDGALHTFLLDGNLCVLAIGNPAYNPYIDRLYRKLILKENNNEDNTASKLPPPIDVYPSFVEIGTIKSGDCWQALIALHNTTDSIVYIDEIVASCDCIKTTLGDARLKPDERRFMTLKFCNDSTAGRFHRDVDIFCKGHMQPLHVKVSGYGS